MMHSINQSGFRWGHYYIDKFLRFEIQPLKFYLVHHNPQISNQMTEQLAGS